MHAVPAQLSLVDGPTELVIRRVPATGGDPILCRSWDLGSPAVRENVVDRPGADGTNDSTQFTGSRNVTLDLVVFGDADMNPYAYVEQLTAMAHPSRRPLLRISRQGTEPTGGAWDMVLRGNPYSITYGQRAAALLELQLNFTAPLGYLEGPLIGYDSAEVDTSDQVNVAFPIWFPLNTGYGGSANPTLALDVGGSVPISPIIYVYGPVSSPDVRTEDGERFYLPGLVLLDGQFVQIDMSAGTVLWGGQPGTDLFNKVDWGQSTFWRWQPGRHVVHYFGSSGHISVHWRERRYTI